MKPLYLIVKSGDVERKALADMAYLTTHKKIRILKRFFEDGLYFPYYKDLKKKDVVEIYHLDKKNIIKEDENFYYFKFPFKLEQVDIN